MKEITRRDFIKTVVIGGAVLSLESAVVYKPMEALARGKYDIGQCKSVRIKCVSELICNDTDKLIDQVFAAGGPNSNQWEIPFDPENAVGSCSLIDMEALDGSHHKFLLDAGWNNEYIDKCFKREGIDKMLNNGEIDFLFISHEHMDHLWGLETVLKYNPEIKIFIPSTFFSEGIDFLGGAEFKKSGANNRIHHKGKLVKIEPGKVNKLFDGCTAVAFDIDAGLRVRGEESLYFNVKDKGFICVTGCCHQNILTFAEFAKKNFKGGKNLYGVYGGLHIIPFGFNANYEEIVKGMSKYKFKKIACNLCTGISAIEKMIELGYPVVKGSGRFGSKSKLNIGNGDEVFFG
jgi:7,8-dihydropterin-6-yl-methyl-4-(beta-D-ribofuranosyl)aminobenzene 5'-phosphate synthase